MSLSEFVDVQEEYEEEMDEDEDQDEVEDDLVLEIDEPVSCSTTVSVPTPSNSISHIKPGISAAARRIMIDAHSLHNQEISRSQGFVAEPKSDDNVMVWRVRFFNFESGSELQNDLNTLATLTANQQDYIELEMVFPDEYPFQPPFIRVVSPRFQTRSGHVTCGGALCMMVLTTTGWSSALSIESLLLMVRSTMIEGGARIELPARHIQKANEYSEREARDSFHRVALSHGWQV